MPHAKSLRLQRFPWIWMVVVIMGLLALGPRSQAFGQDKPALTSPQSDAWHFKQADAGQIRIIRVFRHRVLVQHKEAKAFIQVGERLGQKGYRLASAHQDRLVFKSQDNAEMIIFERDGSAYRRIEAVPAPMRPPELQQ